MRWVLPWISVLIALTALAYLLSSALLVIPSSTAVADEETTSLVYLAGSCPANFGSYDWWLHDSGRRGSCGASVPRAADGAGQEENGACLSRLGTNNAWLYANSPGGVCEREPRPTVTGASGQ